MKRDMSTIIVILIAVIVGGAFFSVIYMQQSTNEWIEAAFSEKPCDTSEKGFEFDAKFYDVGPPPDTYLVKVYVETTALWTNVRVGGMQSITVSDYTLINDIDPRINVDVRGLEVKDISRPGTNLEILPVIALEFVAVIQKGGDTAIFRINKGNYGNTTYKLYSIIGDSTEEIARFIHDGTEEDVLRTFSFDLGLLSSPLVFPSVEERYDGPLFDAHLHLVGTESEDKNRAEDDRLFINPDNADEFFDMMDKQGVIGLIGFLPVIHESFVNDPYFNKPFHKQTLSVLNRCDNKIIPFQYPYSHVGIPSKKHSYKLPKLIEQTYSESSIPFRGIGELHTEYPQTDSYADMRLIDPAMLELYDYAAENNLIVMIHPLETNLEDLHRALQHNRKTIFLLHGGDGVEKILPSLFQENDNLYYSLDVMLFGNYNIAMDDMTKEEFLNNLHSNEMYYNILATALHNWKPLIEEYPDRFMWGTDALYSWHFEHEVYSELTWFTRDFMGGLNPDVQERFGYKNAERMLSGQ